MTLAIKCLNKGRKQEREEEREGGQKGEKEGGKKKRKEISILLSFVKSLEGQEPQEATALLDLL